MNAAKRNSRRRRAVAAADVVVVLLLLFMTGSTPCWALPQMTPVLQPIIGSIIPYGIYSILVDTYAKRVIRKMQEVPSPDDYLASFVLEASSYNSSSSNNNTTGTTSGSRSSVDDDDEDTKPDDLLLPPSMQELRKTISRASNLVERPKHRRTWNHWAGRILRQQRQEKGSSSSSSIIIDPDRIVGNYTFAYRSYVDFEEKNAICKALRSCHWFLTRYMTRHKGQMFIFYNDDNDDVADPERPPILQAVIMDHFWGKRFFRQPITITWTGHVVASSSSSPRLGWWWWNTKTSTSSSQQQPTRIEWTRTEMALGRKGHKELQVIANPPVSEEKRVIPWEILHEEDGVLLFRRGSSGVLAYDRE